MTDFLKSVAIVLVIAGVWVAVPVFGAILGAGAAVLFIYFFIKEYSAEMDNPNKDE